MSTRDTTDAPCLGPQDHHNQVSAETRPQTAPSSKQPRSPLLAVELPRISVDAEVLSFDLTRTDDNTAPSKVPQHASSKLRSASSRSHRPRSPPLPSEPSSDHTSEARLPPQRRPPASFSSNGIETSFGPPPALIARRSYTSDIARKAQSPAQQAQKQQNTFGRPTLSKSDRARTDRSITIRPASSHTHKSTAPYIDAKSSLLSPATISQSLASTRDAMDDGRIADNASSTGEDEFYDAHGQPHTANSGHLRVDGGDTSGQSSDDLFLKLANDAPESKRTDGHSQLERKLVSAEIVPTLRRRHRCDSLKCMAFGSPADLVQSRGRRQPYLHSPTFDPEGSQPRRNSSSHDSGYGTRAAPLTNDPSFADRRRTSVSGASIYSALPTRNPPMASSEQRLNAYRSKYMGSTPQSPSLAPRSDSVSYGYRRPSAPDASYNRPQVYRPSRLNYSSNRDNDLSSQADTSSEFRRASLRDGVESVVSSTAQSAMWDELNELKSRLQKIEFGDKPQPTTISSGGTMSNGSNERPRTATTTITTMSSSPKIAKPGISSTDGTIGGPAAANIHPLLHQSLARCKQTLPASLYRSLETAASDALEMAVLAGSPGSQSTMLSSASIINGAFTDRQLRRKADNVCRSLIDLCISLCEGKPDLGSGASQAGYAQRPGSRGVSSLNSPGVISPTTAYTRHTSLEPEPNPLSRATPSRALDRVEARRASLMSMTFNTNSSPRDSTPPSQLDSASAALATPSPREALKPTRIGTSLMRTRRRIAADEEDEDAAQRPISRATTDIGTSFRKRANRLSGGLLSSRGDREYTSQHPLPAIPSNPNLPKPTPLRRMGGTTFIKDEANSAPSSLQRERTQKYLNRDGEPMYLTPDASTDDERKVRRRSLGLYSSARTSLGLSRKSSLSKRSVVAGD